MTSALIDSNKSAAFFLKKIIKNLSYYLLYTYPAQSPTLSPTKSAITAGFLGSSSGIPYSILPIKSAPTSAALVNIL